MSGWNQLCTDVERRPVETQSDCNEAANSLGMEFKNESSFSNPPGDDEDDTFGCFVNRYDQAYWNRQRTEANFEDTRAVCQIGNENTINSKLIDLMYNLYITWHTLQNMEN